MAARLGVEVYAALGPFREDMGKAAAIAESSAKKIEGAFANAQAGVATAGRKALNFLVGTFGTAALARELSIIKEKTIDDARSMAQLDAVLKSTGYSAGLTANQLELLADQVKNATTFDDDDIRKAETALLRFRDVQGEVFKETIRLAPAVATVLGTDLPSAAIALGRALSGEGAAGMKALKSAGVLLSESIIDLAARMDESGNKSGAMRLKLDEIRKSIGTAAGADAQGLYGQTKNLTRAWDDLQKTMGRKLFGNDSFVARELTLSLQGLAHALENIDRLRVKRTIPFFGGQLPVDLEIANRVGSREASGKINTTELDKVEALRGQKIRNLEQEAERLEEQEKESLRRRAAGASAFFGAQLALQKAYLEQQNSQDEFAFSRGTLTIEQFYDRQKQAALDARMASVESIEQQIAAARKLANSTGTTRAEKYAEEQKIETLLKQSQVEQVNVVTTLNQLNNKRIVATEKLADAYSELAERIALANGEEAKAAAIAFERENREKRRGFQSIANAGGPGAADATRALAQLDTLGKLGTAQGTLTERTRDYQSVVESLSIAQARLDLQAQTGSLTEIDLLNKRADLARQYIPILIAQANAYEAAARALKAGTPESDAALQRLAQMRLAIDQLSVSTDALGRKFSEIFERGFADAFTDFIDGTKSAKDAFKSFAKSVLHDINSIVSKQLANALFGGSSAIGGGIGGLFAMLFGGSAAGASAGLGYGTIGSSIPAGPFPYASGTNFHPGGWAMVGEHGKELINLPRGSQVIPNHELMARREQRHERPINVTVNNLPGVDRRSGRQAAGETVRRLMQAR